MGGVEGEEELLARLARDALKRALLHLDLYFRVARGLEEQGDHGADELFRDQLRGEHVLRSGLRDGERDDIGGDDEADLVAGLGLAIVRDVAEIYGGAVDLRESEDLGGLMSVLRLPRPAVAGK